MNKAEGEETLIGELEHPQQSSRMGSQSHFWLLQPKNKLQQWSYFISQKLACEQYQLYLGKNGRNCSRAKYKTNHKKPKITSRFKMKNDRWWSSDDRWRSKIFSIQIGPPQRRKQHKKTKPKNSNNIPRLLNPKPVSVKEKKKRRFDLKKKRAR